MDVIVLLVLAIAFKQTDGFYIKKQSLKILSMPMFLNIHEKNAWVLFYKQKL